MRLFFPLIFGLWVLIGIVFADTVPQKKTTTPAKKTTTPPPAVKKTPPKTGAATTTVKPSTSTAVTKAPAKSPAKGTTTATKGTPTKRYTSYRRTPVRQSRPTVQAAPTSDRFKEIQDALAAKGYLKTPSNGLWDQNSMDAMQRFQKDQNLEPTGKLTARSITALGLGPKPSGETSQMPASSSSSLQ